MLKGSMIVSLKGQRVSKIEEKLITHPRTIGIILFSRNVPKKKEDLKILIAEIQKIAINSGKEHGMPIFIDQEGGFVQRFSRGFSSLPANEIFGKIYDISNETGLELARQYGALMAKELLPFGVISLCPVIDLKAGNEVIEGLGRAFHSDPKICAKLAEAYIEGMNQEEMLATGKHFPGHGQPIGDSHIAQPIDTRDLKEIEENDLYPFKYLIEKNKLIAIMPAHIIYTKIDDQNTAGMSKKWLNDILRDKMNFKGIIISDCLSMKGSGNNSYLEKTKQALTYGNIALLCNLEPEILLNVLDELDEKYDMTKEMKETYHKWIEPSIKHRLKIEEETIIPKNKDNFDDIKLSGSCSVENTGIIFSDKKSTNAEEKRKTKKLKV